ncbi:hypothetical protein FRC15_000209 [Serendipita sp. 397]|nr:hypothetical protein FRC15_000209 [Serendipita sp. 397]
MVASSSSTRPLPSLFALSALILQPVLAENWNPRIHVNRRDYIAPRTTERIPRPLKARADTVKPGQPTHTVSDNLILGFEVIGDSGVSGQQLFLGDDTKVYIIDKVENNPLTINDHPAWASEYDLTTNTARPLEVVTNTFCAGGALLGTGEWLNIGGNQAVDALGVTSPSQNGSNLYQNSDGAFAARTLTPGEGAEWYDDPAQDLTTRRWYPSLETIETGRIFILGGNQYGGFVNNAANSNPTFEFWPKADGEVPVESTILKNTLPANLYPITHLIPTGQVLLNINLNAAILDYHTNTEYPLPAVPHAVRTYPASAANVMLPMTVANNWTATVMYCGGSDLQSDQWTSGMALINVAASDSCISITPETSNQWVDEDPLPEGRVMGNAILLPDGTVFVGNGANTGVAGYGNDTWVLQESYANNPIYAPLIYDPSKPSGQRWNRDGLKSSEVARMYHSTATLLPDGSVFITGSNPHPDYSPNAVFPTEYRVERFYPWYYNKRRPEPSGIPTSLTYGGQYFDLELSSDDLFGNIGNINVVKVVIIKTGFSTHAINFGQRMAELDHTFTTNAAGGATLHVSQAPPNAAIMQPGPAWDALSLVDNEQPRWIRGQQCGFAKFEIDSSVNRRESVNKKKIFGATLALRMEWRQREVMA